MLENIAIEVMMSKSICISEIRRKNTHKVVVVLALLRGRRFNAKPLLGDFLGKMRWRWKIFPHLCPAAPLHLDTLMGKSYGNACTLKSLTNEGWL